MLCNNIGSREFMDYFGGKKLDELQDAVFDAEDLLDEIKTKALGCKVEADEN
ncbi:unnamed protein product [Prunus armeniaca]